MVESKFKFWSIFTVSSSILLFGVLIFVFSILEISNFPLYLRVLFFISILFLMAWLVFGELRKKAIKVKIDYNTISVTNFLGLGLTKVYSFTEFDGFKISILPSEYQEYEYLFLLINKKKAIIISQFYHSNYSEMKSLITRKTKNLGTADFSLIQEAKDIFTD